MNCLAPVSSLTFSIADIVFHYIYSIPISLSSSATIHNFICHNSDIDIENHIVVTDEFYENNNIGNIIFRTPAWTLYEDVVYFHPNNIPIARMHYDYGFSKVTTYIKDLNFHIHPLPICITGFLLQMHLVQRREGLIMHGAVIQTSYTTVVLTGNSGVGKSTLSGLFAENDSVTRISDDRFILRRVGNELKAYGNPFDTKLERNHNTSVSIKEILFLHHGVENQHYRINQSSIKEKLLQVSMLPYWNRESLSWSLAFLKEIIHTIPCYDLFFVPNGTAVQYIHESIYRK